MALSESSTACPADSALVRRIMRLKGRPAFFLTCLDNADEAIPIARQVLADQERVLGADHPATLASRNYLALAYQEARRVSEAITLLERTLADRKWVLGADDPETVISRYYLALTFGDAGRPMEAITLLEQAATE